MRAQVAAALRPFSAAQGSDGMDLVVGGTQVLHRGGAHRRRRLISRVTTKATRRGVLTRCALAVPNVPSRLDAVYPPFTISPC
jgi:hypothetical protein